MKKILVLFLVMSMSLAVFSSELRGRRSHDEGGGIPIVSTINK